MDGPKGKDKNMVGNDNGGHDTNKNDDDITYKATIVSILMDYFTQIFFVFSFFRCYYLSLGASQCVWLHTTLDSQHDGVNTTNKKSHTQNTFKIHF